MLILFFIWDVATVTGLTLNELYNRLISQGGENSGVSLCSSFEAASSFSVIEGEFGVLGELIKVGIVAERLMECKKNGVVESKLEDIDRRLFAQVDQAYESLIRESSSGAEEKARTSFNALMVQIAAFRPVMAEEIRMRLRPRSAPKKDISFVYAHPILLAVIPKTGFCVFLDELVASRIPTDTLSAVVLAAFQQALDERVALRPGRTAGLSRAFSEPETDLDQEQIAAVLNYLRARHRSWISEEDSVAPPWSVRFKR